MPHPTIDRLISTQGAEVVASSQNEAHSVGRGKKIINGRITDEEAVVFFLEPGAKRRFRWRHRLRRWITPGEAISSTLTDQGHTVKTDLVERPRAKAQLPPRQQYQRPLMAGLEISALGLPTVGTAGLLLRVPQWGDVLTTNWHVIVNPYEPHGVPLGRTITQPDAPADGECTIGSVVAYKAPALIQEGDQWSFSTADKADFALIRLRPGGEPAPENGRPLVSGVAMDGLVDQMYSRLGDEVHDVWDTLLPEGAEALGFPHYHALFNNRIADDSTRTLQYQPYPKGLGTVEPGDKVWKSGRTTGITHGVVRYTNVLAQVNYRAGIGVFRNLIMIDPDPAYGEPAFSRLGDSGSAILDYDGPFCVGNGFAGADGWMLANRIQDCLAAVLSDEQLAVMRLNRET